MSETRFALITTVIIVCSYIVAMTVSSLATVLAYVGSTGSTSISFILPGLFYYKISAPGSTHEQRFLKEDDETDYERHDNSEEDPIARKHRQSWRRRLLRRLSLALALYGIMVMVVCLASNTYFNIDSGH